MKKQFFVIFTVLTLAAASAMAATPKPQQKWRNAGKPLHAKAAKLKAGKQRDHFCTAQCKKKGAKKASDLGACKAACTFG